MSAFRNSMITGYLGIVLLAGCSTSQVAKTSGTDSPVTKARASAMPKTPGLVSDGFGRGGMMGGGMETLLPRTFDATASGKTEVEASRKACIDARKVARNFHSEAGFLNVTKTKKKTNGWTATCEVKEFSTVVDSQNGPAKGPVLDVDFKVCRVEKGTCKGIVAGMFATSSGVPVPVGSTTNTAFVSEIQRMGGLGGRGTEVAVPSIVKTGFEAVFTPIVDKNGRIRVAFTLDDGDLKEIKTLKNGTQYPVVDKALSKSGTLDLASGETKSVDLGKGFRMTVSTKVTSSPMTMTGGMGMPGGAGIRDGPGDIVNVSGGDK